MAMPVSRRASSGNRRAPAPADPALLVEDRVVDRVVDRPRRLPAGQGADRADVRLSPPELLEALAVRVLVRDELDARIAAGALDDPPSELDDRDLRVGADVEHLADAVRMIDQLQQRLDGVRDVREAAALSAVAEDRQVLSAQRLTDEARQDHPVLVRLPRADAVEQP